MSKSAIYRGWVMHRRLTPRHHHFKYRVFSLLLDLDELPASRLRLLTHNRFGLFSFHDADHGPNDAKTGKPLRAWLDGLLADAGITAGGARRVLCYPRILGYVFNPISVWFCHDSDETLKAIVYEVHNTYEERHAYVLLVDGGETSVSHATDKDFYVSPFLSRDCRYHFRIHPPDGTVAIAINESEHGQPILTAAFYGARTPLTDGALLRMFFAYPLMTLKVVVAIHFEAVRLMLKGVRRHPHAPKADYAAAE